MSKNIKLKDTFLKFFMILQNIDFNFIFYKRKKILIYDWSTCYSYLEFFRKKDIYIHHNRIYEPKSKVNFYILLWTVINFFFYRKKLKLSQRYSLNIIKIIKPSIIVTFSDYDFFVYEIKKYFPNIKIVVFQHQLRSKSFLENEKIVNIKKKYVVDYTCVFGKSLKKYYALFLKTKFKIIGSLKNNFYKKYQASNNSKKLVLISSFRPNRYNKYFNDKKLKFINQSIKLIMAFCKNNNIKLYILTWASSNENISRKDYSILEEKYYNKILGIDNFQLIKKNNFNDSYNIVSKFKYFVSFNSTLAYELFSRNHNVAILRKIPIIKNKKIKKIKLLDSLTSIKTNGYFWTSNFTKKEIFRVLNNIFNLKKNKANKLKKKYIEPFMSYDYKCKKNKIFLKKVGFELN